jgi:hypothetical protein
MSRQHAELRRALNGKSTFVKLPTQVAPGDCPVRHKIIALHLAVTLDGAEFHPSCTEIRIGGPKRALPISRLSHNHNYSGIYDPSAYSCGAPHTHFPGGPVPARGYDTLAVREHLIVVSRGKSLTSSTAKDGTPMSEGIWFQFWRAANRDSTIAL